MWFLLGNIFLTNCEKLNFIHGFLSAHKLILAIDIRSRRFCNPEISSYERLPTFDGTLPFLISLDAFKHIFIRIFKTLGEI